MALCTSILDEGTVMSSWSAILQQESTKGRNMGPLDSPIEARACRAQCWTMADEESCPRAVKMETLLLSCWDEASPNPPP